MFELELLNLYSRDNTKTSLLAAYKIGFRMSLKVHNPDGHLYNFKENMEAHSE